MTKRDLQNVAIKLFGLYLVFKSIETVPMVGVTIVSGFQGEPQGLWYLVVSLIPLLILISAAIYCIKRTSLVEKWLSSKEDRDGTKEDKGSILNKETLQEITFSGIGLFFIANALPRLIQVLVNIAIQIQWGKSPSSTLWSSVIGLIMQAIVGIYLFFSPKKLVELYKKVVSNLKQHDLK